MPASRAARASSTFSPCSILYWFSKPPAAARVVPKAEMKRSGVGLRDDSWAAHLLLSSETNVVSLAGASEAAGGVRREIVSMRLTPVLEIRLVRMWEP